MQEFNELYHQYKDFVYQTAYRMTRSRYHAEETVQEVFARAWRHRVKLSVIADKKSWLFIITKRIVFDYVVKLSKEKKFLSTYNRNAFPDHSEALLPLKCRQLLAAAEQRLTPRQRQVFYMRQAQRLSKSEIARRLNISEATAVHHLKTSARIVKHHIWQKLDMEQYKRA